MLKFLFGKRTPPAATPDELTANDEDAALSLAEDKPLLSELEALQEALHTRPGVDTSTIPILDDIVTSSADREEEQVDIPPSESPPPERSVRADFEHELLIQEVIDELLPTLEARLRERLLKIDSAMLEQWHRERSDPPD
jgi:hypothetical protein